VCILAQNSTLLSKFLIKLHSSSSAPWASWFYCSYGWAARHDLVTSTIRTPPFGKAFSPGSTLSGRFPKSTLAMAILLHFCLDLWIGPPPPLNERFPTLFSYSIRPNACVSFVLSCSGLHANLRPRLFV
jgi:hypothetical protein